MRAHRRAVVLGAVALGFGAALAAGVVAIATGRSGRDAVVFARTAKLTASNGAVGKGLSLDGASLVARRLGGKQTLGPLGGGDEVIAPLTGSLTPVAATGSDGSFVVYSSWRQLARIQPDAKGQGLAVGRPVGVPSIRLFDVGSGKDELLAIGAASPAVSTSGAIAYLAGDSQTVRQNVDYVGRIVVADSRDAKPRVWTSMPARYLPYAWAGGKLLVHRGVTDSEGADLYAYSGPDEAQLLAPDAFAIAVSPDGTKVLAAVGIRTLEVIRVADAAVEDSLSLDAAGASAPHAVMYGGSWQENGSSRNPTGVWSSSTSAAACTSKRCSQPRPFPMASTSRFSWTRRTFRAGPMSARRTPRRAATASRRSTTPSSTATSQRDRVPSTSRTRRGNGRAG